MNRSRLPLQGRTALFCGRLRRLPSVLYRSRMQSLTRFGCSRRVCGVCLSDFGSVSAAFGRFGERSASMSGTAGACMRGRVSDIAPCRGAVSGAYLPAPACSETPFSVRSAGSEEPQVVEEDEQQDSRADVAEQEDEGAVDAEGQMPVVGYLCPEDAAVEPPADEEAGEEPARR